MDIFLTLALIIITLLVLGYLLLKILLIIRKNPTVSTAICLPGNTSFYAINTLSTVTHNLIGKRGDMGNQMFQIACVIAAGKRSNANIVLPTRIATLPIVELFDLTEFDWVDIVPDVNFYEHDNWEDIMIPNDGLNYNIAGYRQCVRYFSDYSEEIRRIFTPRQSILHEVHKHLPSEYIAVHIRRGDYIKFRHKFPLLQEFTRCQLNYYKAGIKKLRLFYPDCQLFICTDDQAYVEPWLNILEDDFVAKLAPKIEGVPGKFSDFCVIYLANAVIEANSTYSWFAAFLRGNRSIVAPYPWWNESSFIARGFNLNGPYLYCDDWHILHAETGEEIDQQMLEDNDASTLSLYKLIRGMIM